MSVTKEWFQGKRVEFTDLSKDDRSRLRPIVGACAAGALVFVLLYLAFWPTKANAQDKPATPVVLVAEVGENRLSLFQDACPLGGWFATWKKAQWFYQGRNFDACWKIQRHADGVLYANTVDADGDTGFVPISMFRKVDGV